MSGAYREDLAYIHHIGFGHLANNAAEVLLTALQHGGIDRGLVIDLCCGEDWTVLMSAQEEHENRLLTRRITTFRKVGELYRRDEEIHRLRLVARSELLEALGDLGFEVDILESYGQLQLPPGLTGFLAHKVLQA